MSVIPKTSCKAEPTFVAGGFVNDEDHNISDGKTDNDVENVRHRIKRLRLIDKEGESMISRTDQPGTSEISPGESTFEML